MQIYRVRYNKTSFDYYTTVDAMYRGLGKSRIRDGNSSLEVQGYQPVECCQDLERVLEERWAKDAFEGGAAITITKVEVYE